MVPVTSLRPDTRSFTKVTTSTVVAPGGGATFCVELDIFDFTFLYKKYRTMSSKIMKIMPKAIETDLVVDSGLAVVVDSGRIVVDSLIIAPLLPEFLLSSELQTFDLLFLKILS